VGKLYTLTGAAHGVSKRWMKKWQIMLLGWIWMHYEK
jgi:hypothetical protein